MLFVSCVQKTGPEGVLGNYSVTCDKTVSAYTGSGNSERRYYVWNTVHSVMQPHNTC